MAVLLLATIMGFWWSFGDVHAQEEGENLPLQALAVSLIVDGADDPVDGDVVCSSKEGYVLCSEEYSQEMFGVVDENPALAFGSDVEESVFVVSSGVARVRVKNTNGGIAEGDLVTSSTQAGVGQLAVNNGYVLGTALGSLEGDEGVIPISLKIHPTTSLSDAGTNLWETLKKGLSAPILGPVATLRYLLAAVMVAGSFGLAFFYFGRMAKAGLEAVGRNPLARGSIMVMVTFNIMVSIAIAAAGVGVAYLILIL